MPKFNFTEANSRFIEKNEETILLTAKPKELQKFVKKYLDTEAAFEDGLEMVLYKTTDE